MHLTALIREPDAFSRSVPARRVPVPLRRILPFRLATLAALVLAALVLGGCASAPGRHDGLARMDYDASERFPVPEAIQPNVDFWRQVYGVWSRGEVAFHDDEHLDVVYEVAALPGSVQGGYTNAQRQWVQARKASYRERLRTLESKVRRDAPLSADEQALLAKLERAAGRDAVYGAAERVRSQRGIRERFRRGLEISGRYDEHFREVMRAKGVPEDLAYLPHVESSFQTHARSSVGAAGIWQFMPATGRHYGMRVDRVIDERLDPITCADSAARYLAAAHRLLGSWPLAITSYNHGKGGMANAKAQHGDDIGAIVQHYKGRAFGFSSRNFYASFVAAREVAGHPARYFGEGVDYEQPWSHERIVLRSAMPAEHVAQHYGIPTARLGRLNLHWRKPALDGRARLPGGTVVWLPQGSLERVASLPPAYRERREVAAAVPKAASPASTPAPKYHVVKPDETLYRVAIRNGISVEKLRKLNRLGPNENTIRVGQRLRVSG
jgi:membrane-bound lytic murein transglycosylase D